MLTASRTPHILIVDDDQQIRTGLVRFLTAQGFRASQAKDGSDLFRTMGTSQIDLVVLDVMLPGDDGFALCRKLRASNDIPVVLLTAVSGESDRIQGLELGADDYICKPFQPRELLARIRAILRRVHSLPPNAAKPGKAHLRFLGWSVNLIKRTLTSPEGALVELTAGEFELLQAFLEHPQTVLTRDQLVDLARGRPSATFDRSMDVQVMRLRRKIEPDAQQPTIIKTVRNSGYCFTAEVEAVSGDGFA